MKNYTWSSISTAIVISLIVFIIWIGWAIWGPLIPIHLMRPLNEHVGIGEAGSWGESFSALNTLFSGFAMVGLILTIRMQNKAMKQQDKEYHKQLFDRTFYELLKLQREVKDELSYRYSNHYVKNYPNKIGLLPTGQESFDEAYRDMTYIFKDGEPIKDLKNKDEIYRKLNLYFYPHNDSQFSVYFRITHNIIRKIKDDKIISDDEKIQYANLLRSQMTDKEVCIVGLNGLSPQSKRLPELITYARLLRYAPQGPIKKILDHHYSTETFEPRGD